MKGLNLSKFKKHSSDVNSTTLMHPDGHKIVIAHKNLKGELKKQIESLPHYDLGGTVANAWGAVKEAAADAYGSNEEARVKKFHEDKDTAAKKSRQNMNDNAGPGGGGRYAKGGYVNSLPHYNEGTPEGVPPYLSNQPMINTIDVSGGSIFNPDAVIAPQNDQSTSEASRAPATGNDWEESVSKLPPATAAPAFDPYAAQQTSQQPDILQQGNPGTLMQQGHQEAASGLQNQANAQGNLGKQEAPIYKQQADKAIQMQQDFEKHYNDLETERQNIMHDIANGHIDPQHYINSMSDMGKVSTAIGMILGGLGGSTLPVEFLNKQIDRDIEAQKANMNNKHNLLTATMQQFGNIKDATAMTKALYADIYTNKLAEAAAKSADPQAKARAQQAIGELKLKYAPELQQLALKQTVLGGLGKGHVEPEQAVQFVVPKEHQAAVFKEIERAQNARHNESAILNNFDEASKQNTVLRRGMHLGAEPASLTNVRNMLMPILKDNEGRINEQEINMMEDFLPKAGDADSKIAEKRKGLQQFIEAKKATPTAKGYGIDLATMPSTAPVPNITKRQTRK